MSFENHQNAKKIYDYYQKRFCIGSLGVWHAMGLFSLFNKNENVVLSSMIIASGGSFKSQILKSFSENYSSRYWEIPFQPTDRGIVRDNEKSVGTHNDKIWYIDDAAVSFPSLEAARQSRLVGLFTTAIMDQKYSYSDFNDTKIMTSRFGLYMNIAYQNFFPIKDILEEKTFLERVVPFNYILPRDEVDKANREYMTKYNYGKYPILKVPNINKKIDVVIPDKLFPELQYVQNILEQNCLLSQNRAHMWSKIIMCSIALMEGRKEVTSCDFNFLYNYILPYLSLIIRKDPIEIVMTKMLRINNEATLFDFEDFIKSDYCVKEFPGLEANYNFLELNDKKKFFDKTKFSVQEEIKLMKRYGVEFNVI